ncbi:hypothetical protein H0H93_007076 [Arthromyces matolae]|nr:hypothetical protein H0H93_007076 [Arthromyces matolae]
MTHASSITPGQEWQRNSVFAPPGSLLNSPSRRSSLTSLSDADLERLVKRRGSRQETEGHRSLIGAEPASPEEGTNFRRGLQIDMKGLVGDAVGNMSISPSSRDVVLAARRGLFIIDLEAPLEIPRFLPQGGTWDVADVQWNPHPSRAEYIVSTSSERLYVTLHCFLSTFSRSPDLSVAKIDLEFATAHYRAITDINWHTTECDTVVSTGIDSWIWAWDLRQPRKPIFGLSAFKAGGTQVKWNRQDANILASSHADEVLIWDRRKGSLPIKCIKAHDAKIYGIDWAHDRRDEIVTCSLDKTIKTWDTSTDDLQPKSTINTAYPVWRARALPFGRGVLSLAQRGYTALDMYSADRSDMPTERFEGHTDVVKEFVWRKGGEDEYQLITWSKDRTLRFWPVAPEVMERVGHGVSPTRGRRPSRSVTDRSYRNPPEGTEYLPVLSAPVGYRSILAEVRAPLPPAQIGVHRSQGGTMSKGGPNINSSRMDAVTWLSNVKVGERRGSSDGRAEDSVERSRIREEHSGNSSFDALGVAMDSGIDGDDEKERDGEKRRRSESRVRGEGDGNTGQTQSLQEEITSVLKKLQPIKINLEKHDLTRKRSCTLGLYGPWGDTTSVFIRVTFTFPRDYPQASPPTGTPTVDIERNPLISLKDRAFMLRRLATIREQRPCLESCLRFLLFRDDDPSGAATAIESESSSSEDEEIPTSVGRRKNKDSANTSLKTVKNLVEPRTSQGTFGPNGELVSFFREPRANVKNVLRGLSDSPATPSEEPASTPPPAAELAPAPRMFQSPALISFGDAEDVGRHPEQGSGGGLKDMCGKNAMIARSFARYEHERAFRTLQAFVPSSSQTAPALDALANKVIMSLYNDFSKTKDIQMLAMLSVLLLQIYDMMTSRASLLLLSPDTLPDLTKEYTGEDYFSLQHQTSHSERLPWPRTPTRPQQQLGTSVPSSTSSRGSWSSLFNAGSVRQFMSGVGDTIKDGLTTPNEGISNISPPTILPPSITRSRIHMNVQLDTSRRSLDSIRRQHRREPSLLSLEPKSPLSPVPVVASKSWNEPTPSHPTKVSPSFSSVSTGNIKRMPLAPVNNPSNIRTQATKQKIVFKPSLELSIPEEKPVNLFNEAFLEQLRLHIRFYADLMCRWQLYHKRLELLKSVRKQTAPLDKNRKLAIAWFWHTMLPTVLHVRLPVRWRNAASAGSLSKAYRETASSASTSPTYPVGMVWMCQYVQQGVDVSVMGLRSLKLGRRVVMAQRYLLHQDNLDGLRNCDAATMGVEFGSFNSICQTAALVICPLVGTDQGIEPSCYSRNVDVGGTMMNICLVLLATCFVHIVAIIMTAIMIYHIRSKYTAVGRKEIVTFFWLYMVIELLAMFLDSGIIPTANVTYPFLRIGCLVIFGLQFFFAIATFKQIAGFTYTKPIALWIMYILWPVICAVIYIVSQLVLVFRTLEDRWPIGDIIFGAAFFAIAQVLLFAFSVTICDAIKHYIDGLFFFTLCMLLSVMMVYKYWDSITVRLLFPNFTHPRFSKQNLKQKEDLEFSVGSKAAVWEVKDPLLAGPAASDYAEEDGSNYHGGAPGSLVGGVSGQQLYNPQKGGYRGYPPTDNRY